MAASPGLAAWGKVRQLGYVVEDLDAALRAWSGALGVGPWTIFRNVTLQCLYRGEASAPRIDVALSYRGALQIELIQQTNDVPSPYRDFIERRQFGLHHIAFFSANVEEDLARAAAAGLEPLCDIRMPGGHYAYLQSPVPGERSCIELLEATPALRQMFEQGTQAAAAWDGAPPPTVIDFAAAGSAR